jgi:CRP/FNR family transcriptional regulator
LAEHVTAFETHWPMLELYTWLAEQRVAAHLLRRAGAAQSLETTHEQIAHHVGSSREVVSRVLRNIARSGALALSPRSITIIDAEKLRGFVE